MINPTRKGISKIKVKHFTELELRTYVIIDLRLLKFQKWTSLYLQSTKCISREIIYRDIGLNIYNTNHKYVYMRCMARLWFQQIFSLQPIGLFIWWSRDWDCYYDMHCIENQVHSRHFMPFSGFMKQDSVENPPENHKNSWIENQYTHILETRWKLIKTPKI